MIWTWWMDRCLVLSEGMDGIDPEILEQAIHSCGMDTLRARREELRQLELESYAAIGRRVVAEIKDSPGGWVAVNLTLPDWVEPLFQREEK